MKNLYQEIYTYLFTLSLALIAIHDYFIMLLNIMSNYYIIAQYMHYGNV